MAKLEAKGEDLEQYRAPRSRLQVHISKVDQEQSRHHFQVSQALVPHLIHADCLIQAMD